MSGSFHQGVVRVRVPATSANLGPGFDSLGLALGIYDEVTAEVTDGGLAIKVTGEGTGAVALDETHLVVQAMRATFDLLDGQPDGLGLTCLNTIPHGRGLGSSAAAIVAGVLLADALSGGSRLTREEMLALAAGIEGHPDNVAACLFGGLTVAWTPADGIARAASFTPSAITPVLLIPDVQSATSVARQALPDSVSHPDAAFNTARAALLTAALINGPTSVLWDATQDRLHQTYRSNGMPESSALMASLRALGTAAVISGAGPTVLVLCGSAEEVDVVRRAAPSGWRLEVPSVDFIGAAVLATEGGTAGGTAGGSE